jgi:hypothetical protein
MHTVAMERIVIIGDNNVEYRLVKEVQILGARRVHLLGRPWSRGKRHPAKACGARKHENRDYCYSRGRAQNSPTCCHALL